MQDAYGHHNFSTWNLGGAILSYNNGLKRDDVRGDETKVTDEMLICAIYDDRSRVEV